MAPNERRTGVLLRVGKRRENEDYRDGDVSGGTKIRTKSRFVWTRRRRRRGRKLQRFWVRKGYDRRDVDYIEKPREVLQDDFGLFGGKRAVLRKVRVWREGDTDGKVLHGRQRIREFVRVRKRKQQIVEQ